MFAVRVVLVVLVVIAAVSLPAGAVDVPPRADVVSPPLKIAAASDLAFAFKEIAASFEKSSGQKVELAMGSTGQFARQIAEGAPFDVFAAANVSFVDDVVTAGACDGATKALYGQGRIVLWSNQALGFHAPADLRGLLDKRYVKVAIANPEHAPYGKAAQQAMRKLGIWEGVKPKLVYGENIQQTLKYAQSGNVEVAIVALSLALATPNGDYRVIDAGLHEEINQGIVVCGKDPARQDAARAFAAYVRSPEGRSIMKRFGFVLPGES